MRTFLLCLDIFMALMGGGVAYGISRIGTDKMRESHELALRAKELKAGDEFLSSYENALEKKEYHYVVTEVKDGFVRWTFKDSEYSHVDPVTDFLRYKQKKD